MGKLWKIPKPGSFELRYVIPFFVCFGVSIGASFGWRNYMEDCCSGTVDGKSYVFIPWVVAFTLIAWTIVEIMLKMKRLAALGRMVAQFHGTHDAIYAALSTPQSAAYSVISFQTSASQEVRLHQPQCVQEMVLCLFAALVLALWQASVGGTHSEALTQEDAVTIVSAVTGQGVAAITGEINVSYQLAKVNVLKAMFSRETAARSDSIDFACTLLRIVSGRASQMSNLAKSSIEYYPLTNMEAPPQPPVQMFTNGVTVEEKLSTLGNTVREFFAIDDGQRLWAGISVPVMIMGILYPILIPPIFYSTMGADIVYIGPVLSIFVTGAVMFNVCMADPIRNPNTLHFGPILERIYIFAVSANNTFVAQFPQISAFNIKPDNSTRAAEYLDREVDRSFMIGAYNRITTRTSDRGVS